MNTDSTSQPRRRCITSLAALSLLAPVSTALAVDVDLELETIRVTQAIRFVGTQLVAGNVTMVRAIVDQDDATSVPNVDAIMHVAIDGVEPEWSPVRSINGPISVPLSSSELEIDDHVNFLFVAPESNDVDITIVLNPDETVPETSYDNNTLSVDNLRFLCRAEVELVYVPIDYIPGGGLPDPALIEPGIGDGFLRAIFHPGAWDYHISPLPPLVWTQNINGSNSALLNTLRDIRLNQLPAAGYDRPDLIYGWLPGNPFSGNGQANGIPGDAAFGNTQTSRHQRTFAHEIGHLLNESHNGESVGQVGIDVEHHLHDVLGLDPTHASNKYDIMVAGQVTSSAFVSSNTYNQVHADSRLQCGGAAADAAPMELLRVSGVYDHRAGTLALDPISYIERGLPDAPRAGGNTVVILRDANGNELGRTTADIGSTRELCNEHGDLAETSPLHVTVPRSIGDALVSRIDVVRGETFEPLASRTRSAHRPEIGFVGLDAAAADEPLAPLRTGARVEGRVRLAWAGADVDGDALTHTLLYSRDGGASWLPLAVNLTEPAFDFDADELPGSIGATGLLRVVTTDGFNHKVITSPPMALGGNTRPRVHLLTPNDGAQFSADGNIILHATAWDAEDGRIADDVVWTSSVDGVVATGALRAISTLSPGTHTLTASIEDAEGEPDDESITITIRTRTLSADLDYNGFVELTDLLRLLEAWGPCGSVSCPADLTQDGTVDVQDLVVLLYNWG